MRILFAYFLMDDAGSAQDVRNYAAAARALGHEVMVYGPPGAHSSFAFSNNVEAADAVVFIFEWTTNLRHGDNLDFLRLIEKVPRQRRVVIDCDGGYNEALCVNGDYNHFDAAGAQRWMETCEALADKICQPTFHPLRPNVRTFFFHGYDPGWEQPLDFSAKDYGMIYVGHSKFRWRPMQRVLDAVEPIRAELRPLAIIGHGWDAVPSWAGPLRMESAYFSDYDYLRRLNVRLLPPIAAHEVIPWMSKALFNPVIYRPLFGHLRFVTCRTFETFGAATIPLLGLEENYVAEIYGERAVELVLPAGDGTDKIRDIARRPQHYAGIVREVRRHLAEKHSYSARLNDMIKIICD
jgi:hypothetical protein